MNCCFLTVKLCLTGIFLTSGVWVKLRENEVLDSGVKADPREHVWTGDYQKNHWVYKLSGV